MDKLFRDFDLQEISEKTHISYLTLKKLKLKTFDGFNKVKLKGFIKILKKEYPDYDFTELENDIDNYFEDKTELFEPIKEEKSYKVYIVVIILIVLIVGLLFVLNKDTSKQHKNQQLETIKIEKNITQEINITQPIKVEKKEIKKEIKKIEENKTIITEVKTPKKEVNNTLAILPISKVWMRVTYLDNFKSKTYLTKKEVDLNGSRNIFILLGHGYVTFKYKDNNLTPYTKKVTRVVLIDGELNVTKKKLKEFK